MHSSLLFFDSNFNIITCDDYTFIVFELFLLPYFALFSLTVQAEVYYGSKLENASHSFISCLGELNNFLFKKTMYVID